MGHSCTFRSNLVSFRTFRRPLFPKPVSCPGLFFTASYSKTALTWNSNGRFKINFLNSRLHDGDESSPLPSPPPVPSLKSEKRVTCNATNNTGWLNCYITVWCIFWDRSKTIFVCNFPKLQLSNLSSVKLWTRFEFRKKLSKAKNFTWFRGFNFWTQKWTKLEWVDTI